MSTVLWLILALFSLAVLIVFIYHTYRTFVVDNIVFMVFPAAFFLVGISKTAAMLASRKAIKRFIGTEQGIMLRSGSEMCTLTFNSYVYYLTLDKNYKISKNEDGYVIHSQNKGYTIDCEGLSQWVKSNF